MGGLLGDLTGFSKYFIRVILKSESWQTKLENIKKSQVENRSDTLIRHLCPRAIQRVHMYRVGEVSPKI